MEIHTGVNACLHTWQASGWKRREMGEQISVAWWHSEATVVMATPMVS